MLYTACCYVVRTAACCSAHYSCVRTATPRRLSMQNVQHSRCEYNELLPG
jgi:hypothetical protein